MEFCHCRNPEIVKEEGTDPYCGKCGFWWDKKYGSTEPGEKLPESRRSYNQYRAPIKIGRNEQCPCGSGKKFKKCHGQ